jgi:hypothetical protein
LLYTDSTIALNPDTGKLAWYFQHQPNDQWDYDWAFGRMLLKTSPNGKTLVATGGKQAIFGALEADKGFSCGREWQWAASGLSRTAIELAPCAIIRFRSRFGRRAERLLLQD